MTTAKTPTIEEQFDTALIKRLAAHQTGFSDKRVMDAVRETMQEFGLYQASQKGEPLSTPDIEEMCAQVRTYIPDFDFASKIIHYLKNPMYVVSPTLITEEANRVSGADADLSKCPECKGPADNGHDRCFPPNVYLCKKCSARYARLADQKEG